MSTDTPPVVVAAAAGRARRPCPGHGIQLVASSSPANTGDLDQVGLVPGAEGLLRCPVIVENDSRRAGHVPGRKGAARAVPAPARGRLAQGAGPSRTARRRAWRRSRSCAIDRRGATRVTLASRRWRCCRRLRSRPQIVAKPAGHLRSVSAAAADGDAVPPAAARRRRARLFHCQLDRREVSSPAGTVPLSDRADRIASPRPSGRWAATPAAVTAGTPRGRVRSAAAASDTPGVRPVPPRGRADYPSPISPDVRRPERVRTTGPSRSGD